MIKPVCEFIIKSSQVIFERSFFKINQDKINKSDMTNLNTNI